MSDDPLIPVWQRLANEPAVFYADRPEPAFAAARDCLLGLGFIRAAAPARFTVCRACGGGHVRSVVWVEDAASGTRRPFVPCPECGLSAIDADHLRVWAIDIPQILAGVRAATGGRGPVQEVVRGRLWSLGRIPLLGHYHTAYFARNVHGRDRPAVLTALAPHPRAVLFHPTEHSVRLWEARTPNLSIAMDTVVSLESNQLRVDVSEIEGRLVEAGWTAPKAQKPRRRGQRAANIERLVDEMKKWLRDARDHACATRDLGGVPQLLPRPTQKQLAERTGLDDATVSRCLNDNKAVLLQLLWRTADDLESVLAWDGSVAGDCA